MLTVDMSKHVDEVISTKIEVPKWKESGSLKDFSRYVALSPVTVFHPMTLSWFHALHCQIGFQARSSNIGCRGIWCTPNCSSFDRHAVSILYPTDFLDYWPNFIHTHARASGENKNRGSDGKR